MSLLLKVSNETSRLTNYAISISIYIESSWLLDTIALFINDEYY